MADVIFILIVVAFFGLMVLLVRFADRVIGPDELAATPDSAPDRESDPALDASTAEVGS